MTQPDKTIASESTNPDGIKATNLTEYEKARREESDSLNLYRQCMEIRNFEIQNLVNRNNFFMVFQGVLMAGVIQGSKEAPPLIIFLASACGFLISMFQVGMSQGAKYWQEAWEYRLARAELRLKEAFNTVKGISSVEEIAQKIEDDRQEAENPTEVRAYPMRAFQPMFSRDRDQTLKEVKKSLRIAGGENSSVVQRRSVSKIPIYSGMVFCLFWLLIVLHTTKLPLASSLPTILVPLPK